MSKTVANSPAHVAALHARHAELEAQLMQEVSRPNRDDSVIARLKKAKLRLKDAILGS